MTSHEEREGVPAEIFRHERELIVFVVELTRQAFERIVSVSVSRSYERYAVMIESRQRLIEMDRCSLDRGYRRGIVHPLILRRPNKVIEVSLDLAGVRRIIYARVIHTMRRRRNAGIHRSFILHGQKESVLIIDEEDRSAESGEAYAIRSTLDVHIETETRGLRGG